jgi:hypothetical protein
MKNWVFKSALTLSMVATTFLARSADQPAATNAPGGSSGIGPKIQFDSTKYDFGRAVAGTMVKHDFVFTNVGDATLQITGVTPGCGCTTIGEWTHQVEPGKTGVIPIQFNSTMYNGPVSKAPSITCNDKAQPMVRFQLHGTVYKALEISPTYVQLNIMPDASEETSGKVHIVNNDPEPLTLETPTINQGSFTAEIKTNVPGKDFDVIIKTVPPLQGNSAGLITVRSSAKSNPSIVIPVNAMVRPLMTAMPTTLTIPAGPITNSESISVSLLNQGSHPITLSDPTVNAQGVEASISTSQPGKVFAATVTFPKGFQVPMDKPMTLTVKTDNPRFPTVQVPIKQQMASAGAPPPPMPKKPRIITQ